MIPRQHRNSSPMNSIACYVADRRFRFIARNRDQHRPFHLIRRLAMGLVSALAIAPVPSFAASVDLEKIIPSNAVGAVFIDTTDQTWGALSQFTLFPQDIKVPGEILLARTGLVFSRDVQPWLGTEVAIVAMENPSAAPKATTSQQFAQTPDSPEPPETNADDPSEAPKSVQVYPVILATVTDDTQAMDLLAKLQALRQVAPTSVTHRDVKIFEWEATPPPEAAPVPPSAPGSPPSETAPAPQSNLLQPLYRARHRQTLGDVSGKQTGSIKTLLQPSDPSVSPEPQPDSPMPSPPVGIPNQAPGIAIAFQPGYVMVAPNAEILKQFLDAQASGSFLAGEDDFRRFQERFPTSPTLLKGYGNLGKLLVLTQGLNQQAIDSLPPEAQPPIPRLDPQQLDLLSSLPASLHLFIWAETDGLRLKYSVVPNVPTSVLPAEDDPRLQALANPNQILTRLPGVTYLTATGFNPAGIWSVANTALSTDDEWNAMIEKFRTAAQAAVGFDDRDILPWMDSELAFFVYPARDLPLTLNMGTGLMVQTSDRQAAEAFLAKLDQWGKQEIPGLKISSVQIKGQPVTSWDLARNSEAGFGVLAYTWLDDKTLLVTNGRGGMTDLVPKPFTNLADAYSFQRAIAPLPKQNTGYFYMDTGAVATFVFNVVLPQFLGPETVRGINPILDEFRQLFGSIRSFSATASFTPREGSFEAFLALGRRK